MSTLNENKGRTESSVRLNYTKDGARCIVGYYGGTTGENSSYTSSSDSTSDYTLDENISLYFVNGDTLQLVLKDPNLTSLATQYTNNGAEEYTYKVTVTLSDAHGNQVTLLPLTAVNGSKSFTTNNSSDSTSGYEAVKNDTVGGYVYTLDSITGSTNYHFGAQFPTLYLGDKLSAKAQAVVTWNQGSSSKTRDIVADDPANSLFDNDTTGSTAYVSNIRHLENLSTTISGIDDSSAK